MQLDINVDVNQIIEQIKAIADPAVKHGLEIYAKQAVNQGYVDITVGAIFLAGALMLVALVMICVREEAKLPERDPNAGFLLFLAAAAATLAMLFGYLTVDHTATGYQEISNPEYYAVQNMIQQIRS